MLEGLAPEKKQYSCKIRTLLTTLEPSDSKILADALNNPDWTSGALARALNGRGVVVSDHVIARHRKKECTCA